MAKRKSAKKSETVGDAVENKWAAESVRLAREVERLNQRVDNMMERVVWLEDNVMASSEVEPSNVATMLKGWNLIRLFKVGDK